MAPIPTASCPLTGTAGFPPVAPIPCSRTRLTSLSSNKIKTEEMKLVRIKIFQKIPVEIGQNVVFVGQFSF